MAFFQAPSSVDLVTSKVHHVCIFCFVLFYCAVDGLLGPTLPPDVKVNAVIQQRFPEDNRAESTLPTGIEIVSVAMPTYGRLGVAPGGPGVYCCGT